MAPAERAGAILGLGVSASSPVFDAANANNTAAVSVEIAALPQASADLSVRLLGSALPLRRGTVATFLMPVRNAGPDKAEAVKVMVQSNVAASYAAVAAPRGWTCSRMQDTATGSSAQCTRSGEMDNSTQTLAFAIVVPGKPKRGTALEFKAQVSASTPDPDSSNNQASLNIGIR